MNAPKYGIHDFFANGIRERMIVWMKQPVISIMIIEESLNFSHSDKSGMAMYCAANPTTPMMIVYVV